MNRVDVRGLQCPLDLPDWVGSLFVDAAWREVASRERGGGSAVTVIRASVREAGEHRLVSICIRDAAAMGPLTLQRSTAQTYRFIRSVLAEGRVRHALRCWNFIPEIGSPVGGGLDRYMAFNAGRFAAYTEWYGEPGNFVDVVPTATGVGHHGHHLMIHVLAGSKPGVAVENPRQEHSYRYSELFGPMPPCFARGTIVQTGHDQRPTLLVGGTASVRGEATMHVGDIAGQTEETLVNLSHLVDAAVRLEGNGDSSTTSRHGVPQDPLSRFTSLRIHVARPQHAREVMQRVQRRIPHLDAANCELVEADICRPELLVEIEGTADVGSVKAGRQESATAPIHVEVSA